MDDSVTIPKISQKKVEGEKIVALTAYDYSFASLLDQSGVDIILVGDSAAMVCGGQKSTLPLTLDEALYHCRMARRGVQRALLVADMPFLSYQVSPDRAVYNAGLFFKRAEVDAVKIEGGLSVVDTVRRLVDVGMPVMGHLGLTPQSIRRFGSYSVQAQDQASAAQLLEDALALQEAGAFSIVLEKIPKDLAKTVTKKLSIPTIGIGAGPHCDGQILVTYDMLGLFEDFRPKFVRRYAELAKTIQAACARYADDVRKGTFPDEQESF
ncbi:3-methyl-2-oxobutanoate hydroxymethyltransferase [candidate division KSB1 bacterium]|nr:3-methyl-2-oxobutanoate hydroxymethyltransferase [candidate division KSB1 bacterium]